MGVGTNGVPDGGVGVGVVAGKVVGVAGSWRLAATGMSFQTSHTGVMHCVTVGMLRQTGGSVPVLVFRSVGHRCQVPSAICQVFPSATRPGRRTIPLKVSVPGRVTAS